jgi:hypothetical protein
MSFRESEYSEIGVAARWLDPVHAKNAYNYALQFSAKRYYGLCETTVSSIEHLDIESYAVADAWVKARMSAEGTVQVVYGGSEVCVLPAAEFLANWQRIFMPARDDAIVLHNLSSGVLFYCHEEELEYGQRKA